MSSFLPSIHFKHAKSRRSISICCCQVKQALQTQYGCRSYRQWQSEDTGIPVCEEFIWCVLDRYLWVKSQPSLDWERTLLNNICQKLFGFLALSMAQGMCLFFVCLFVCFSVPWTINKFISLQNKGVDSSASSASPDLLCPAPQVDGGMERRMTQYLFPSVSHGC